ncbi:MAG: hypothetical protein M9894_02880 [Planctomycetes bacterium]|nr:hypothetical protein [Planctomycetota bacterium]
MGDAELRAREREAAGDPDPTSAGRLLAARVRAGRLAPERLAVAAALGDPAALAATGVPEGPASRTLDDVVAAAAAHDAASAVRAIVLGVARLAPEDPDPISQGRLEAARAWTDCPCPRHAEEARRLSAVPEFALGLRGSYVEAALRAAEAASLAGAGHDARDFLGVALRPLREGAPDAAALAAAVREDLVAWVLRG